MSNTRRSQAKRFATLVFVSVVVLVSIVPLSQSAYQFQVYENSSHESANQDVPSSLGSPVVAQRAPAMEEKLLVLRAALVGSPFDGDNNRIRSMFTNDVKSYYLETSYGQVSMNATYINKNYSMPETEAYYGTGTASEPNVIELIQFAIEQAEADVNASGGYKAFRHIVIVHSGSDQAATHQDSDITSQFLYREGSELFTLHGVKIMNASVVSESDPLGVVVHELGHSLGLPDLYSYATSETGDTYMGEWDLMATGSWNPGGQGTSPSHPSTWCKFAKLGWISAAQVANYSQSWIAGGRNATVFLNPQEKQNLTLAIKILLNDGTYYMIESRMKTGYDGALPSNGVLVILCNDSKGSGQGPAVLVSANPPDLRSGAAFNVGWFTKPFFGDELADIGVKVLNKWSNGTFKVFVGDYNAALSMPTEYQDNLVPVFALVGGGVIFVIVALVIYLKKGRQKSAQVGYDSIPVIKLS